jgi:hypothetical protein
MDILCSLLDNVTIRQDGAYRNGDHIVLISHSTRIVRGLLKYTFLDGNPPIFTNFSLDDSEEDGDGKSYFMLDGTTPYSLSLLEASYVLTLIESEGSVPQFIPSLYYSHNRDDFFILNVDGTTKHIFHIPFILQFIHNFDDFDYVIHYIPIDSHAWCEPISMHQSDVLARIFHLHLSELSSFDRN